MLFEDEIKGAIESVLFITNIPIAVDEIAELVGIEKDDVQEILTSLIEEYNKKQHGICIIKRAGGYQMATKSEYKEYVEKLYKPQLNGLSNAALETLAIVAYKQPVTKGEMELLRGVNVDGAVQRLVNRGLIEEKGRKDTPGRPIMYGTTVQFLQYFGLDSIEDLPHMNATEEHFKEMTMFDLDTEQSEAVTLDESE